MLNSLFKRFRSAPAAAADVRVADGHRVYAVGDIHGRADLLVKLHDIIRQDSATAAGLTKTIVYLGDYVDRGHQSREVIDQLLQAPLDDFTSVYLKGNHEDLLLRFLEEDVELGPPWFKYGGAATAMSYGVSAKASRQGEHAVFEGVRRAMLDRLPVGHLEFLRSLTVSYRNGDYVFVHAGLRPGRPLDQQTPDDMMWIRDDFLRHRDDFGVVVVHGHSISGQPENRGNRIGVDTGAYATNVLTCVALEGTARRFLTSG